jgi:hypothetical protein
MMVVAPRLSESVRPLEAFTKFSSNCDKYKRKVAGFGPRSDAPLQSIGVSKVIQVTADEADPNQADKTR